MSLRTTFRQFIPVNCMSWNVCLSFLLLIIEINVEVPLETEDGTAAGTGWLGNAAGARPGSMPEPPG